MCKLAEEINQMQQTRYNEAIANRNKILQEQLFLRQRAINAMGT